ncbi:MAG: hypothetical protein ACOCQD_02320 [archaeon]
MKKLINIEGQNLEVIDGTNAQINYFIEEVLRNQEKELREGLEKAKDEMYEKLQERDVTTWMNIFEKNNTGFHFKDSNEILEDFQKLEYINQLERLLFIILKAEKLGVDLNVT